jgi:transposase
VLERVADHSLIKWQWIGVDASTMQANAALGTPVQRGSGEGYREMLTSMARESGIETPTCEDLIRIDRNRKGKKLSNADWKSPTDPGARISQAEGWPHASGLQARASDGPRHRDRGCSRASCRRPGRYRDAAGDDRQRRTASCGIAAAPTPEAPAELIADMGYHSRAVLKDLEDGPWKARISEPKHDAFSR